ncbi:putative phospholipid-transporting ATPase ID, partial [Operophtera brumata]
MLIIVEFVYYTVIPFFPFVIASNYIVLHDDEAFKGVGIQFYESSDVLKLATSLMSMALSMKQVLHSQYSSNVLTLHFILYSWAVQLYLRELHSTVAQPKLDNNNYIKTSKYSIITFLPLNLLEQFQRLANFYFLCLLVLQLIPAISSLTPITTAIPLIGVLALTATAAMSQDDAQLGNFDGEIVCETPNNLLNKFDGTLSWRNQHFSLDNDKILLRGCVLRNTQWCYGVVIVFFLLSMCVFCTVACGVWEWLTGRYFQVFLPWDTLVPAEPTYGAVVIALLVFFSYAIVMNTVVPISLYVSVEVIRFAQSFLINWDEQMYYEKTGTAAKARTTTLNEEL